MQELLKATKNLWIINEKKKQLLENDEHFQKKTTFAVKRFERSVKQS